MQLPTLVLAALTAAMPALAFTNGSLVPAYICNPKPDGLPKNYGQLLAGTREMTGPIAFNANGLLLLFPLTYIRLTTHKQVTISPWPQWLRSQTVP